jgi:hypothetical protein
MNNTQKDRREFAKELIKRHITRDTRLICVFWPDGTLSAVLDDVPNQRAADFSAIIARALRWADGGPLTTNVYDLVVKVGTLVNDMPNVLTDQADRPEDPVTRKFLAHRQIRQVKVIADRRAQ